MPVLQSLNRGAATIVAARLVVTLTWRETLVTPLFALGLAVVQREVADVGAAIDPILTATGNVEIAGSIHGGVDPSPRVVRFESATYLSSSESA